MFRKSVKRRENEDDYVWVDMFQFVTTSENESEDYIYLNYVFA